MTCIVAVTTLKRAGFEKSLPMPSVQRARCCIREAEKARTKIEGAFPVPTPSTSYEADPGLTTPSIRRNIRVGRSPSCASLPNEDGLQD